MFSLFKSFLCSNLSIWLDRPVVPNGSQCYISILDGLVYMNRSVSVFKVCDKNLEKYIHSGKRADDGHCDTDDSDDDDYAGAVDFSTIKD